MSDSNHDGNDEEKNSLTLSHMPIHILSRIVNELDFPSQTKLQRTCHGFQNFINSHNSTCKEMIVTFKKNQGLFLEWSIDDFNVQYIERQNGCLVKIGKEENEKFLSDTNFLEIGLADFKSAIRNPNFKIKSLSIRLVMGRSSFNYRENDHFFNKLSETLKSLNQKLNVEKLKMHTYNNEKYAISILSNIQAKKLNEICLGYIEIDSFNWIKSLLKINQLTSLEHWKTTKSLKIFKLYLDIPVESIIHFDEFTGTLTSLSPENIVFLKEVYLQSDTFKACYIEKATDDNEVALSYINIEAVNRLLGPVVPFDRKRQDIRHYPIPNSNQWLLMKITPGSFHIYKTNSPDSYLDPPKLK